MLIYSALGIAQSRIDSSVYVFEQDRIRIGRAILSPIFNVDSTVNSFGEIQLDQSHDKGSLRMAQQAYEKKVVSFRARGFNKLGKFKIGAQFLFNNQLEDSLSNNLRNDLDPLTPYYPYASKSGHYRRQNYKISTLLSYEANTYIIPFVLLDYHKHWTAGTVDPRIQSDRFILKVKPGLAFRVKNHSLAVSATVGKADETVGISFTNDQFKTSLLYPDRIYYSNYGYGYSRIRDSLGNIYKYDTYSGFHTSYQFERERWTLQAAYNFQKYHNTNQYYPNSSLQHKGPRAIFDLNTSYATLYAKFLQSDRFEHMTSLSYRNQAGTDGSKPVTRSLDIVNYKVNEHVFQSSYSLLMDRYKPFTKEFGVSYGSFSIRQQDLLQGVLLDASNQEFSVFTNVYLRTKANNVFKAGFRPYVIMPRNPEFQHNTLSLNDFIRNVANTDYHYYSLNQKGFALSAEYITRLFYRNSIGVFATLDYHKSDDITQDSGLPLTFDPTGHRTHFNVGLRMYINSL